VLACFSGSVLSGCALESDDDAGVGAPSDEGAAVGTVAQGLATDISVYANTSTASPWQTWSWWSTVALANADAPLASGSTSQIKATVQTAGGALSLAHSTYDLTVADYDAISFDVRAPASSSLRLSLQTLAGGSGVQATIPVTTTWTRQTVQLDALKGSLTKFGKINWTGPQAGQTFYVDNVKVVAKRATTTSTFPTAPITVTKNSVVTLSSSAGPYSLYVPTSYDATHNTPTKVLVWLHGCGGAAYGDAWTVSPGGTQSWVSVSVGGRDGACWNVSTDATFALAALDDVKRRLNVDPRRVVIGGYSSGGNLAYRTAFYNAKRFAGVIAENTSPFYGTGSSQSASVAAAAWKLNVAHLAHLSDTVFQIGTVRAETDALTTAGFPQTRVERSGTHWDADTTSSGTNYDLRTRLLPYLDAGWVAPP
jgi:predicted esterase